MRVERLVFLGAPVSQRDGGHQRVGRQLLEQNRAAARGLARYSTPSTPPTPKKSPQLRAINHWRHRLLNNAERAQARRRLNRGRARWWRHESSSLRQDAAGACRWCGGAAVECCWLSRARLGTAKMRCAAHTDSVDRGLRRGGWLRHGQAIADTPMPCLRVWLR